MTIPSPAGSRFKRQRTPSPRTVSPGWTSTYTGPFTFLSKASLSWSFTQKLPTLLQNKVNLASPLCSFVLIRCSSCSVAALVFHCCFSYFIAPTALLLFLGALLLCGVLSFLYALLLHCSPTYLYAPCCFIVVQCFATPLLKVVFPPFLFLFFEMH